MKKKLKIFLDSGAFSAFTKEAHIDLDEYIAFIKKHKDILEVYANLDVIGDPEGTLRNQKYMESKGLRPLPTFHFGESPKYLKLYLKSYDYIAIGGMVPISTERLVPWLDGIYSEHLCDGNGLPKVKVHGFGMTTISLMIRYPWYSVDSTAWVLVGRFGGIFVPKKRSGKYDYFVEPMKILVSSKSTKMSDAGRHITTFSSRERAEIMEYIESRGFKIGKSSVNEDGEEVTIENGLSNDYMQRDRINITYFLELEKALPKWPWPFKGSNYKRGFGF